MINIPHTRKVDELNIPWSSNGDNLFKSAVDNSLYKLERTE